MTRNHNCGNDISVVVVTYNAEQYIEDCLKSVEWADEIVVIDLGSQDKTLDHCEKLGVKVYNHPLVPIVERVRSFGASFATKDWILYIDPDERVSADLAIKLQDIASDENFVYKGVKIPRQNIIFDQWLKYGEWWPDWQIRFGQKKYFHFSDFIHEPGRVEQNMIYELQPDVRNSLIHYPVPRINSLLERIVRYSATHAEQLYAEGRRFSVANLFADPLYQFYRSFIAQEGYRDGSVGLILNIIWKIFYPVLINIYLWEMDDNKSNMIPKELNANPMRYFFKKMLDNRKVRDVFMYIIRRERPIFGYIVYAIAKVKNLVHEKKGV